MPLSGSAGMAPTVRMPCGAGASQLTSLAHTRRATTKVGKALVVLSHVLSRMAQAVVKAWDPAQEDKSKGT